MLLLAAEGALCRNLQGLVSAPPALFDLSNPPGCDGPGAPPPGCARHWLQSTPVAVSGQGPPLFNLPDQGKHFFVGLLVGLIL